MFSKTFFKKEMNQSKNNFSFKKKEKKENKKTNYLLKSYNIKTEKEPISYF